MIAPAYEQPAHRNVVPPYEFGIDASQGGGNSAKAVAEPSLIVHGLQVPRRPLFERITETVLVEMNALRGELARHFEGAELVAAESAAALIICSAWLLEPESVTASLSEAPDLDVHMLLPNGEGSVDIGLLFTPGVNPFDTEGLEDEEDNVVINVFDAEGCPVWSCTGPLLHGVNRLLRYMADAQGMSK